MFGFKSPSSGHSTGNPNPFCVTSTFGSPFAMQNASGTTTSVFGTTSYSPFPTQGSQPALGFGGLASGSGFSSGSALGFSSSASGQSTGNSNSFGVSSTFGSPFVMSNASGNTTGVFGTNYSPFSTQGSQSALGFGGSASGSGFSSGPALGFSSSGPPAFGQTSAVGASNTTGVGQWTTVFRRSDVHGSTKSSFGTQSSFSGSQVSTPPFGNQTTGSRVATYARTSSQETTNQVPSYLESITAMPIYEDKSHEQLRWEDYEAGDKGGIVSGNFNPKPNAFNSVSVTCPPFTSSFNPFLFTSPSTTSSAFSSSFFTNSVTTSSCSPSTSVTLPVSPFGPTSTSSPFGPTSSSSPFGPITSPPPFGPTTCPSPFGPTSSSSPFGPGPTTSPSPFGPTTSPSPFGPTTSPSPFGPSSSASPFGPSSSASPFGPTTSPSSFGPTTSPSPFGPTTSPSPFGPNSSSSPFGPTTSSSPFGPTTSSSMFGPTSTSSPFGPTSSSSPFGPTSSSSPFGPTTCPSPFGPTTSPSPFGPTTSPSPFGPTTSPSPFGPTTSPSPFGPTTSQSPFGPTTSPSPFGPTTSPSPFGPTTSPSPFGPTTSPSPFGPTTSPSPFGPTTSPSPFGPTTSSSMFGPTTSSSMFGPATSSSMFGPTTSCFFSSPSITNSITTSSFPPSSLVTLPAFPCVPNSSSSLIQPSTISASLFTSFPSTSLFTPTTISAPSSCVNPFGSLPPIPMMSIAGTQSSPTLRYGISSLPVQEKPAPVRMLSLGTIRHISRRNRLPVLKYDPKINGPKVPFFMDDREIAGSQFVPRENPRSLVIRPTEHWPLMTNSEKFPVIEGKLSSTHIYDNGENLSSNVDAYSEKPKIEHADDALKERNSAMKVHELEELLPKLQLSGYFTEPQIQELAAKERAEPGFCSHVKNFVVGRHGYGSIMFMGETDVRSLDLESIIEFNKREVIVYKDESKKPGVGEGLNKPAEVTLLNIKCLDKKTGKQYMDGPRAENYRNMLKKKAEEQGAEYVSYDPVGGEWKFRVQHF